MNLSDLRQEVQKLSPTNKLLLAAHMFGTTLERDNVGQFIIYTGLTQDSDDSDVRPMTEQDLLNQKDD